MIDLVHRTVFVHVPKCGGQSVEAAFCAALGLDWDRHRHLLMLMKRPRGWHGRHGRLAHLRALDYLEGEYLPVALWAEFYTFAMVRNPYARLASAWRYLRPSGDFADFVAGLATDGLPRDGFLDPAISYLTDEYGGLLVKDVWRLEEMPARWPDLAARAGIEGTPLPHRNKAPGRDARPLRWTQTAIAQARDLYAEDFSRLGYDPEDAPPV